MLSATLAKYDIKQIGLECTIIHVNFVSKIFVRNFLITISSFISMHTIYYPYMVVLVKKFCIKKFSSFCTRQKIFNSEISANHCRMIKFSVYISRKEKVNTN